MLTSSQGVGDLLEGLEVRYLANRDKHLHFALLTDWPDSNAELMPEDQALLELTREGIESLNVKYKAERSDIFFAVSPSTALESSRKDLDGL